MTLQQLVAKLIDLEVELPNQPVLIEIGGETARSIDVEVRDHVVYLTDGE